MLTVKYFKFYFRLAGLKIFFFVLISMLAAGFLMGAAAMFLPVLNYGQMNVSPNRITKIVHYFVSFLGIEGQGKLLFFHLAAASVFFFISGGTLFLSKIYGAIIETSLLAELQGRAVKKLFRSNYEYFTSKNLGYFTNALIRQMLSVASGFRYMSVIIISIFQACAFLVFPFLISIKMALAAIVFGLFFIPLFKVMINKTRKYSIMNSRNFGDLDSQMIQALSNYKYLKATNTYKPVCSNIAVKTAKVCYAIRRIILWGNFSDMVQPCAVAVMAMLCFVQVTYMNTPLVDAIALLGFLYMSYQKAISIPTSFQKFMSNAGAVTIYQELTDELEKELEELPKGKAAPDFTGALEFRDLSFKYRSGEDEVLKSINLKIEPNSSVAFVGGSGAGKSTIVNLITALLSPTSGEILLSGMPFSALNRNSLRSKIGYVTQEPVVFDETIYNNITLWKTSGNNVEEAAEKAHAKEFIDKLPKGFDTLTGDRGVSLSGGQRQRITIARELLRDTPMLILDEATSSLDSETEQCIQKSIDETMGSKTIIIIAHRLSTVKKCDRIFVLENGKIAEEGSYDELYEKDGLFRKMINRQDLGK